MKHVNWGIIAPGKIATSFAKAISHVDGAKLYSVASRSPERASSFAKQHGASTSHSSYEALVRDPAVDVVYVASPHPFHAEQALLALTHNKPVLCEKPMTVNLQQAKRVFQAAFDNQVFCMEAVWTRFMPTMRKVQEWVSEGRIGELKMIKADFGFSFPFDPSSRLFDPNLAGGALLDLGIYPITFAQLLMGDQQPADITATAIIGSTSVDESLAMHLRYGQGVLASLTATCRADTNYTAEILGTEGSIRVPLFWCAQSAELFKTNRTNAETVESYEHLHPCNGYEWEIMETHRCLNEGLLESPLLPWSTSLEMMRIMDTVREQIGLRYPFE